jgi:hypothetical protein
VAANLAASDNLDVTLGKHPAAKALAELITPITAKVVIICFMIYIPRIMIKIA